MNRIKEARLTAGLTQVKMSTLMNIPTRTIQDWEADLHIPPEWAENLIIKELNHIHDRTFKNHSKAVENYTAICLKFAQDTAEWGELDDKCFYSTHNGDWGETSDNAHGGILVNWAFHLTDDEIKAHAGEELYELFKNELWDCCEEAEDAEDYECTIKRYDDELSY